MRVIVPQTPDLDATAHLLTQAIHDDVMNDSGRVQQGLRLKIQEIKQLPGEQDAKRSRCVKILESLLHDVLDVTNAWQDDCIKVNGKIHEILRGVTDNKDAAVTESKVANEQFGLIFRGREAVKALLTQANTIEASTYTAC